MTTADELHAAAAEIRQSRFPAAMTVLPSVAALLRAREPLARWLDYEADLITRVPGSEMQGRSALALAVARALTLPSV